MTLADEVKAVQRNHPGWDFQAAWDHVMSIRPDLGTSTAERNRATAKLAPQKEKETRAQFEHVEAIARRLMARDSKLTFGDALKITRDCLPSVQASIKELLRQPVDAVEPKSMLVQGIESGRQIDFGAES